MICRLLEQSYLTQPPTTCSKLPVTACPNGIKGKLSIIVMDPVYSKWILRWMVPSHGQMRRILKVRNASFGWYARRDRGYQSELFGEGNIQTAHLSFWLSPLYLIHRVLLLENIRYGHTVMYQTVLHWIAVIDRKSNREICARLPRSDTGEKHILCC
jgi:hypothetical protein